LGHQFLEEELPQVWAAARAAEAPGIPWLAALLCAAPFDLALHDAFGHAAGRPVYETYSRDFLGADLAHFYESSSSTPGGGKSGNQFGGRYPDHYYPHPAPTLIPVWHLVGCADVIEAEGGRSTSLREWITRDGLRRLKVKLCGTSHRWDCERLSAVGSLAAGLGVEALSVDFNGTAPNADYVTALLDRWKIEAADGYRLLRYVEQPFAPDATVGSDEIGRVTSRIPVVLDEGASSWRDVRAGFELGYSGVALKTCKTQSAAMLSLCWAREHGMDVVVQDLTNPMLAQISHAQLGAHASPEIGIESNAMQFYPAASECEARVHPGLYKRRNGMLDLSTIKGPGFGYRLAEMQRKLPERAA
jgi:L-alanine-DL-glutamate epimerase-like enolase superfamily enzyme